MPYTNLEHFYFYKFHLGMVRQQHKMSVTEAFGYHRSNSYCVTAIHDPRIPEHRPEGLSARRQFEKLCSSLK